MAHRYNQAGRMLLAAMMTYQLGNRSIDHILKTQIPEEVDESWATLAEDILRGMAEGMGRRATLPESPDKVQ